MTCNVCNVGEAPKHRRQCDKCRNRLYRERNPVMAAYHMIKWRAYERGILFALTFGYFKQWCVDTNYIQLKGRYKDDMSIDRIKPELGYVDGNIQMLTLTENTRKRWTDTKGWGIAGLERQPGDPF